MKYKHLLYSPDEEVFLFYTENQIQHMAKRTVGRNFSSEEIQYLKAKTITAAHNLIIKIDSSGIGNEKES